MRHLFLSTFTALSLAGAAAEAPFGVVNFATCITESELGKKEQENMEGIRTQMSSLIEQTEKELKQMSEKFEDTAYLDGLSPKAEEELKVKFQTLQEDMSRYQNQFYQVLQHANYQMIQKMSSAITQAANDVAKEKNLVYVFNKEALFYVDPSCDVTKEIVVKLNEQQAKKVADNTEAKPAAAIQ